MSFHEIDHPFTASPVAPEVRDMLVAGNDVAPDSLDAQIAEHRQVIGRHLGNVGIALEASGLPVSSIPTSSSHVFEYRGSTHVPREKFDRDIRIVTNLYRSLGPTNPLQDEAGDTSVGLELLANIDELLARDYQALPTPEQRPQRLMTQAITQEMMATLWRPGQAMGDGLERSRRAADSFRSIYEAPNAIKRMTRLEALCRMTDMRIRALRTAAVMTDDDALRTGAYRAIDDLHADNLERMLEIWHELPTPHKKRRGRWHLFEMMVDGLERERLIEAGELNSLVMLGLPNHDRPLWKEVPKIRDRRGNFINLAADVVVVGVDGELQKGYQAKLSLPDESDENEEERIESGRATLRPESVELRLPIDYPQLDESG